jgi:hypothetical protein
MVGVSVDTHPAPDWIAEAASLDVARFSEAHPFFFLIGTPTIRTPRPLANTLAHREFGPLAALRRTDTQKPANEVEDVEESVDIERPTVTRLVLPVRKRTDLFREMISVGRAANNDVVVPDVSVSKFHAYFRIEREVVELIDAGSRNGTRIDGATRPPKTPTVVHAGARIEFGGVPLLLVSPEGCWAVLRRS